MNMMNGLMLEGVDFQDYVITVRPHPAGMGGQQMVLRFPNGFGASVVRFPGSYGYHEGLFEMAVIVFVGDGDDDYELTYDTPITCDVLGYLTPEDVVQHLGEVRALKGD